MVLTSEIEQDTPESNCKSKTENGQEESGTECHSTSNKHTDEEVHTSLERKDEEDVATNHMRFNSVARLPTEEEGTIIIIKPGTCYQGIAAMAKKWDLS